jgi:uncharacterized protein
LTKRVAGLNSTIMDGVSLSDFFTGPVFLSAFFSWFFAQVLKAVVESRYKRAGVYQDVLVTLFWKTGGMPSSHSALVTGLATAIGFQHGVQTPLFTLSVFYGILIIRDALGVRRSAGLQARALNRLGTQLAARHGIEFESVKEVSGHTPSEVSVGILFGFFLAVAFCTL